MQYPKILFLGIILFSMIACNSNNEVNEKATDEVVNDSETLSSDIVNNPQSATNLDQSDAGRLAFADTIHDYGQLTEGEVVTYDFEYTNVGKKEILITDAKGSCGCTVPTWDSEPIAPGAKGRMKVTFDSKGKPGYNEKKVQITTSGLPRDYQLIILATVK